MRPSIVVLAALCLFTSVALADSIDSITPAQINVGDVEGFLTIRGSGLLGNVSTTVRFSAGRAIYEIEPNLADSTSLTVFILIEVAITAGQYTVTVIAQDDTGIRTIGPGIFNVVDTPIQQP